MHVNLDKATLLFSLFECPLLLGVVCLVSLQLHKMFDMSSLSLPSWMRKL